MSVHLPAEYMQEDHVHAVESVWNQSEYPRMSRWARFSALLRQFAPHVGPWGGISPIPYHEEHGSYPGTFRTAFRYPISPAIPTDMYNGEGFLRMQEQLSLPHPSGLSDSDLLTGEALAGVMRGGA